MEFERFAKEHTDWLLRSAYLMCGERSEAEDLVQECLLRIARRWPRVRSTAHPGAYTRRVLFNLMLDDAPRRKRRHAELHGEQERPLGLDEGTSGHLALEVRAELVDALDALSPRQRAVLVLRYFADLPESEVAAILGCSLGTVKSSTSRGLAGLRAALYPSGATAEDPASTIGGTP